MECGKPPLWSVGDRPGLARTEHRSGASVLHDPDHRGVGTVRYPRVVPRDGACAAMRAKRTLTNLSNARPTWLDLAHRRLDEAVFSADGLDPAISDEGLRAALLEWDLRRRPAGAARQDDPAEDEEAGS